MTAPDPGLTDLIAAHWFIWDELECRCGWSTRNLPSSDVGNGIGVLFIRHLALVVEQHTNGRIAELEAELAEAKDDKFYARVELNADMQWKARAEKAEATIVRVEAEAALLERMIRTAPWSRYTEVRRSHLRSLCAALERPGDAG